MIQRTVVTRIYGNNEIGSTIAGAFESEELKKLRMRIDMSDFARERETRAKIEEARRKYACKPEPAWARRMWGYVALMAMIHENNKRRRHAYAPRKRRVSQMEKLDRMRRQLDACKAAGNVVQW